MSLPTIIFFDRSLAMELTFTNALYTYSSAEHYLDISPEFTFKRLVADRKGSTYCYGHHTLMLGVLRALGYRYAHLIFTHLQNN